MSNFESIKTRIESTIDELGMMCYDNGWNAVIDELNRCINHKTDVGDWQAVAVLTWARNRIIDLEEAVE